MRLYETSHDGKPQAGARFCFSPLADESFEDVLLELSRHAWSVVDHPRDHSVTRAGRDGHFDRCSRWAKGIGVVHQIVEDLAEAVPVGEHVDVVGFGSHAQLAVGTRPS